MNSSDAVDRASFMLREIARPMWSDTRENSLRKVARQIGISASQAKRIVYREVKRIDAHVFLNISAHWEALEAKAEAMADRQLEIARLMRRDGEDDESVLEPDSGDVGSDFQHDAQLGEASEGEGRQAVGEAAYD